MRVRNLVVLYVLDLHSADSFLTETGFRHCAVLFWRKFLQELKDNVIDWHALHCGYEPEYGEIQKSELELVKSKRRDDTAEKDSEEDKGSTGNDEVDGVQIETDHVVATRRSKRARNK